MPLDVRRRQPRLEALEERSLLSATLLKDVNLATSDGVFQGYTGQSNFAVVGKTVYFAGDDGVRGMELWKSDGTAKGTVLVKDVNTKSGGAASYPSQLTAIGGTVYFVADDGVHGRELWRSDGTAAGTRLVKDILPPEDLIFGPQVLGPVRAGIENLTAYKGAVYFTAPTPDGVGLWKSDGTTAGTTVVRTFKTTVGKPVVFQNKLFFAADGGSGGVELWCSEGAGRGTWLVKDVQPGGGGSYPHYLTAFKGRLYFAADDGSSGRELWASDGTAAGTRLFADVNNAPTILPFPLPPPASSSDPRSLTVVNDTLYFAANDGVVGEELWKTDGTTAVLVKDINSGGWEAFPPNPPFYPIGSNPQQLTAFKGQLYFVATDPKYGEELWKSDGTANGTILVKDVNPNTYPIGIPIDFRNAQGSYPQQLTVAGDKLYFTADDGAHEVELWATNGTPAGTAMVRDVQQAQYGNPDGGGSFPSNLTAVGDTLFFAARTSRYGVELWKTTGTAASTGLVKDVNRNTLGSNPRAVTQVGRWTYFVARDAVHGEELWKTDGTPAGTSLVEDPGPGLSSWLQELINFKGVLYYTARYPDGFTGLYRREVTAGASSLVKGFAADGSPGGEARVSNLTVYAGKLYFTLEQGGTADLYQSDGTVQGTAWMVRYYGGGAIGNLTPAQGALYFTATTSGAGTELWRTDGTAAGTRLVKDVNPGVDSSTPRWLTAAGNKVFFAAMDARGLELWVSDGTAKGTRRVKDINAKGSAFTDGDALTPRPGTFVAVGKTVYFAADDGVHGTELWKSDGTEAGTVMVKDVNSGRAAPYEGAPLFPKSSSPMNLTAFNGTVYFTADDGRNGLELWKSDGTAKGTVLVKDIWKGSTTPGPIVPLRTTSYPNSSFPTGLTVVNGKLYFGATDGEHGTELWTSDGTTAGTRLAWEFNPGAASGLAWSLNGLGLWAVNGSLYVSGQATAHGAELWKYTPPARL